VKRSQMIIIVILLLLITGQTITKSVTSLTTKQREKVVVELNEKWQFREAGTQLWCDAVVPGCVHTDLLNNKLIEDPFYRDNESRLQWIDKKDWEYQCLFSLSPDDLAMEKIDLVFKGLDTYATVFLNDQQILSADNMFREWRINCKNILKTGENILRVYFYSPIKRALPEMAKLPYQLPAVNDQPDKTSPFTRKAPYQFGWDWGPRFVTCGIWQPVFLEAWESARVEDLHIRQKELDSRCAQCSAEMVVQATSSVPAIVLLSDSKQSFKPIRRSVQLQPGQNSIAIDFEILNPELWWPNGLGAQPLYTVTTELLIEGKCVDQAATQIGLRSLELRQKPDQWGKSFEFVVNGVPVFAKGGNWIPADNFPNRVTRKQYEQLLSSCQQANMNMLRIWGGGIYENQEFYDLCDKLGIMIWQDFMFACSLYPGDAAFLENVRQEATYQVRRLRNHASIVLWCGNNEMEVGWFNWGWRQKLPATVWDDYKKIYHDILSKVCSTNDPARPYWPSSPSSNLVTDANSQEMGDMHYWGVWHGNEPFTNYNKQNPRFMSEYGFQSFPEMKTVNYYALPADQDITSPVMMAHQKNNRGNQLIHEYLLHSYHQPKDFAAFLYVSQLLQAEGVKMGAEHLRRIMPRCMGSLFWQIDDCWPVASWSSIDYFGRWKALHYFACKFYFPVLVSPVEEEGMMNIYVVSDRRQPVSAELIVQLLNFDGKLIWQDKRNVMIPPQVSQVCWHKQRKEILLDSDGKNVMLYCEIRTGDAVLSSNTFFFEPIKELILSKPVIDVQLAPAENAVLMTLTTDKLAKNVYLAIDTIDGFLTDNYFDLIPGKPMVIKFNCSTPLDLNHFQAELKVISLVDSY